ncbi:hypothetical protein GTW43_28790, partial [Streptomyces sp. SID5785]|uniref:hypothetical protein n=1 Tax=Streptomyces sp. SID5785 TaxID=2690309 RepID=UPI001361C72F
MPGSRTFVNRLALALAGGAFLVAGVWLALTRSAWAPPLPGWWPVPSARAVLVDPEALATARDHGWWAPAVGVGCAVLALAFAFWSARLLRGGARRRLALPVPESAVHTRAVEDAVTGRAAEVDGVAHCRARVRVRPGRLDADLRVRLRPGTAPGTVLPRLTELARDTGTALTPYRFHMHIRFTARP